MAKGTQLGFFEANWKKFWAYWVAALVASGLLVAEGVFPLSLPSVAVAAFGGGLLGSTMVAAGIVALPALLIYGGLTWLSKRTADTSTRTKAILFWGRWGCVLAPVLGLILLASLPVTWPLLLPVAALPFVFMLGRLVGAGIYRVSTKSASKQELSEAMAYGQESKFEDVLSRFWLSSSAALDAVVRYMNKGGSSFARVIRVIEACGIDVNEEHGAAGGSLLYIAVILHGKHIDSVSSTGNVYHMKPIIAGLLEMPEIDANQVWDLGGELGEDGYTTRQMATAYGYFTHHTIADKDDILTMLTAAGAVTEEAKTWYKARSDMPQLCEMICKVKDNLLGDEEDWAVGSVGRSKHVNSPCIENGWSPLHYAVWVFSPKVVTALLEKGASWEHTNNDGQTALQMIEAMSDEASAAGKAAERKEIIRLLTAAAQRPTHAAGITQQLSAEAGAAAPAKDPGLTPEQGNDGMGGVSAIGMHAAAADSSADGVVDDHAIRVALCKKMDDAGDDAQSMCEGREGIIERQMFSDQQEIIKRLDPDYVPPPVEEVIDARPAYDQLDDERWCFPRKRWLEILDKAIEYDRSDAVRQITSRPFWKDAPINDQVEACYTAIGVEKLSCLVPVLFQSMQVNDDAFMDALLTVLDGDEYYITVAEVEVAISALQGEHAPAIQAAFAEAKARLDGGASHRLS